MNAIFYIAPQGMSHYKFANLAELILAKNMQELCHGA